MIFDNDNITNDTYVEGTGTLTVSVAGDYYIGWHGYSDANMDILVIDDISIGPGPYTWTGNVNTNWNNPGNWDSGIVPNTEIKVIIPTDPQSNPDRFPVINGPVSCHNITVAPGATILITAPGILDVMNP